MKRITMLFGLCLLATASGCGGDDLEESLEGEWAGVEPVDQSHNELVLEEGGDGSATVYIFRTVDNKPQASPFTFDVDWEGQDEVEIDMSCQVSPFGECEEEDDISMECVVAAGPELQCEADGRWRDYDFRYKKI